MARKITISFKESKKDIELYEKLMELDDKSYFIKELLRKELLKSDEVKREKVNSEVIDVLNF